MSRPWIKRYYMRKGRGRGKEGGRKEGGGGEGKGGREEERRGRGAQNHQIHDARNHLGSISPIPATPADATWITDELPHLNPSQIPDPHNREPSEMAALQPLILGGVCYSAGILLEAPFILTVALWGKY